MGAQYSLKFSTFRSLFHSVHQWYFYDATSNSLFFRTNEDAEPYKSPELILNTSKTWNDICINIEQLSTHSTLSFEKYCITLGIIAANSGHGPTLGKFQNMTMMVHVALSPHLRRKNILLFLNFEVKLTL